MKITNLRDIRKSWLSDGELPAGDAEKVLGSTVYRSWQRCMQSGLEAYSKSVPSTILDGQILQSRIEQRRDLINLAKPTMNYLHTLMSGAGGVVLLSDHQGVIVHSVGDAEFVMKADRVYLKPGASWMEKDRGTNAIGTALVEGLPVSINGSEHFLELNGFLSCAAAPIYMPDGSITGVLDISTDKSTYHPHTIGLVKATVHSLEKQLFYAAERQYCIIAKLHPNVEGLGSMAEGILGLGEDGLILGADRAALAYLGLASIDIGNVKFHQIVDFSLDKVFDCAKSDQCIRELRTHTDKRLCFDFSMSKSYCRSHVPITTTIKTVSSTDSLVEAGPLRHVSRLLVEKMLASCDGNVSLAAKRLGISRSTLYRYLKEAH